MVVTGSEERAGQGWIGLDWKNRLRLSDYPCVCLTQYQQVKVLVVAVLCLEIIQFYEAVGEGQHWCYVNKQ